MEKRGFKKQTLITGLIASFWLCVTLFILGLFGIHDGWPAFLSLTLVSMLGGGTERLKPVFLGCTVGLLAGGGLAFCIKYLVVNLGWNQSVATLLMIFIVIFLIIVLEDISSNLFNSFSFIYFTITLVPAQQATLQWLITLYLGGGFFIAGVILLLKLVEKASSNKAKQTDSA